MPPIGKWIIKSAIAVFLCLCIDLLRNHQGMPFYAAIAAIMCMQPYVKNSVQVAWNRVIGTLIGGVYGVIFLSLERMFLPEEIIIIRYLVVSLLVVLVIYTTVVCRKNEAAYISCVVFLGIALTHGDDVNVYSFAINRMLDTLVGIAVALLINSSDAWGHRRRDRNTLYAIHLDYVLMEAGKLTSYAVVKTNQLIERGARIVLMTKKDPCAVLPYVSGVQTENPVICLNGTLIYDMHKKTYLLHQDISREVLHDIVDMLIEEEVWHLIYSCRHDFLYIYYQDAERTAEEKLLEGMTEDYHSHYVKRRISREFTACFIHAVLSEERCGRLEARLQPFRNSGDIEVHVYRDEEERALMHLEIFRKGVSEEAAVKYLQQQLDIEDALVFGAVEKLPDQTELFQTIEKVYHG